MKLNFRNRDMDMLNGPILPKLLRFAIPLVISSALQLTFNAADVIVVGRFEGDAALAAVGVPGSLINLLVNLFAGLAVGANVVIAQCYGAGSYKDTREAVHTSIGLSILSGLFVGIVGFFMAGTFLSMMDTPPEVLPLSTDYMRIYFLGMPANMVYNFGAAILRAVGDTRRPLVYLTTAGVVNVILNLFFVILFGLGVKGVALATIIAQFISAILVIICLMRSHGAIQLELKKIRLHADKVKRIVRVGLPAGIQGIFFSISNVMIQSTVNGFGAVVVAGNTAAGNLDSYVYTSMNAIYQAVITFTSQNMGGKKYDRISRICRDGLIAVICIGLILSGTLILFRNQLLSIYTSDPAVIDAGALRIWVYEPLYFLCGMMEVMVGMMRGMGSSIVPMLVSLIGVCGIRLGWIYAIFPFWPTQEMLYISYPASWLITFVVHFICYKIIKKQKIGNLPEA